MNFQFENKHYIIIAIIIIVVWMLYSWDKQENFSGVQDWPFLPPKYWQKRNKVKWGKWYFYDSVYKKPKFLSTWNPLWDSEDRYHPAVPGIVHYDVNNYKFPEETQHLVDPQPEEVVVEEEIINNQDDENDQNKKNIIILAIILAGLLLWYFNNKQVVALNTLSEPMLGGADPFENLF